MKRTELALGFAVSLVALASMSCASTTSDDSATAGAGNANPGAGSTSSGAGASPTGGAGAASSAGAGSAGAPTGGAGAPGSAGAAGAAGAAPSGNCPVMDPADMVSDFETGKADVIVTGGRGGTWFLFDDGTGMQTPIKVPNTTLVAEAGGACGSMFGFHTTGSGFTVFGAGFGADFAPKPAGATDSTVYDASAYTGVALYAKAATPISLRVSVSDGGTAVEGKVCTDTTDKTVKTRCGDYFGADVMLTTDWMNFVVPFATMKQRGFGLPIAAGIDKSKVYTIRAQIKGSAAAPGSYDIWLDDVRFVK